MSLYDSESLNNFVVKAVDVFTKLVGTRIELASFGGFFPHFVATLFGLIWRYCESVASDVEFHGWFPFGIFI
jgi:hypothetical protein